MRRKPGVLLPLELDILAAGLDLQRHSIEGWHGFLIARAIQEQTEARRLTAHGTLYKALDRLQRQGLLDSQWEDPLLAAAHGRPRRRLYQVTALGEQALAQAQQARSSPATLTLTPRRTPG